MGSTVEFVETELVSQFIESDLVKLSITGKWDLKPLKPVPFPPQSGTFQALNVCAPKPTGQLSMSLTPGEFNLPALPVTLHLNGATAGFDAANRPLVRWDIHQTFTRYIGGGIDAVVDGVDGHIVVALDCVARPETPTPGVVPACLLVDGDVGCGGSGHLQAVGFSLAEPPDYALVVKGHKSILGSDIDFEGTITSLSLGGVTSVLQEDQASLQVLVNFGSQIDCHIGPIENTDCHFTASVSNQTVGQPVAYLWHYDGPAPGVADGATWSYSVTVPPAPHEFTVSLTVQHAGTTLKWRATYESVSMKAAAQRRWFCHLRRLLANYTVINRFPNPLGPDDPRMTVGLPTTRRGLETLRGLAVRLVRVCDAELRQLDSSVERETPTIR